MTFHEFRAALEMYLRIARGRAAKASPLDRSAAGEVARLEREIAKIDQKIAAEEGRAA